jgi:hypothetical protein
MADDFKYDVFLSHSAKDKVIVRPIAERLRADGVRVWLDEWEIRVGDSIPAKVEEGLQQSRVLVLFMSANAFGSDWATLESQTFRFRDPLNKKRRLVPLSLDDAPIEGSLAQFLHIKWFAHDQEGEYAKLLAACRREIDASGLSASTTQPSGLPSGKSWTPAVLYPLQPAPHFEGRAELVEELTKWATNAADPVRVVALVAAGGTGKTALAERVLNLLQSYTAAGVFVWSFYENPQTEAFLREACRYFTGIEFKETGGLIERLQQALTGDTPHLLILDGLELVQAPGDSGRPRGELEDPLMRRLVRWVAAGLGSRAKAEVKTGRPRGELEDPLMRRLLRWLADGLGTRAKALITSRFPLPDLADWLDRGFQENHLNDLPLKAAFAVLRGWGVQGTDKQLLDAIRPLQDEQTKQVHALSVSVLGSYLGKLWHGDISKAPTFNRKDYAASDPKAAKLTRILTSYAEKLSAEEVDLLARLSMFPRGVTVEILGYLVDAGGEVAGRLLGCNQARLRQMLVGLRDLGLVFRYEPSQEITFTAHPFLRQFFETLHGVHDPKQIHEAVRAKLAPTLKERPEKKPSETQDLDRYERLIEITRLAGQTQQAFVLYWYGLGSQAHLGHVLGDNARGLRIVSTFATNGTPETAGLDLPVHRQGQLVTDWGLFALDLGDLTIARRASEIAIEILRRKSDAESSPAHGR